MELKFEPQDIRVPYFEGFMADESPFHDSAIGSEECQSEYRHQLTDDAFAHGREPSLLNLSGNTQTRDCHSSLTVMDSGYNSRNISLTPSEDMGVDLVPSQFETDAPLLLDSTCYLEKESIDTLTHVDISVLDEKESVDTLTYVDISVIDEDAAHEAEIQKSFCRQLPRRTLICPLCHGQPQGYPDEHELRQHIDQYHARSRRVWICKEAQPGGTFLAGCKACRNGKPYREIHNAFEHLRRAHFNPSKNRRRGWDKRMEVRGGIVVRNGLPMGTLQDWMYEAVEVNDGDKINLLSLYPSPTTNQSTSWSDDGQRNNLFETSSALKDGSKGSDEAMGMSSAGNFDESHAPKSSVDFPQPDAGDGRSGMAGVRHESYLPKARSNALSTETTSSELSCVPSTPRSSLSRAFDSSKSLVSISEGELSFIGEEKGRTTEIPPTHFDSNTSTFLKGLAQRIVDRCPIGSYQHRPRMRGRSDHASSSSESASSSRPVTRTTSATSQSSNLLGLHSGGIGVDEPEDGDTSKRFPVLKRKMDEDEPPSKLFACPYAKFNPSKYSRENLAEPAYWNCNNCCLRDISRLKQHLYRIHKRPDYYCGSCFKSYKSREQLDEHTRQRPPCELQDPKYEDKMTDDQFQAIKRRIIRGDPCELWFNIYSVLFPSAPRPSSPFVTTADATMINHFVNLFRWFGPQELMSMMLDRRQRPGQSPPLELSTQAIVDEAFEIALPNYLRQTQSQSSQPSVDVAVEDLAEEDFLTMAPTRNTTQDAALSNYFQNIPFEPGAPKTAGSIDQLTESNTQSLNTEGWPAHVFDPSQVNAAFDSYAATDVLCMNQEDPFAPASFPIATAPIQLGMPDLSYEISWSENQWP